MDYDVAIVGGGHNALVAAAYLARAGRSVCVLERLDHVGGAAVSERPWPGVDARLSRYSYLVSLLPQRVIDDLGLRIELRRRRYSSYTPDPADPTRGILVDTADAAATAESFARATGDEAEASRFSSFYDRLGAVARAVFPTVTDPLPTEAEVREAIGDDELWCGLTQRPLGELVRDAVESDIARGIVLTDGLIGTFARADEPDLRQNRCFLYHVIGGGAGDWDVPVGGMGTVTAELERAAREAGAHILTGARVTRIDPDAAAETAEVEYETDAGGSSLRARLVLSGVGAAVLEQLVDPAVPASGAAAPEGAQIKVNMLLKRLPRLRDANVAPEAAFAGTFHVNETAAQLDEAYRAAADGRVPAPLPAEIYCHSLTDPTILGPELRTAGAQTLTLFGLQVPHRLVAGADPDEARAALLAAAEASLDSVLAEPIADCLWHAPDGTPCIEARTTADLERSLGMVAGDIFHGPLSWPWLVEGECAESAAERWGVATDHARVLVCGSSARRGGAVSGIGGHNAAMAAIELLADS
ncbi:NAD(P)/FAD-dependent oxidoreductase [uncultured Microbacterium sp.]|uniref:phytoene desaturase family protein n=1 Tax=uncultured Microbacterium sp. TaxID=191216 RepID=UPI0025EA62D1|nr:NAD(P)/FAD-dependent oxidoreductase [uncultured Microbacterium sp.]